MVPIVLSHFDLGNLLGDGVKLSHFFRPRGRLPVEITTPSGDIAEVSEAKRDRGEGGGGCESIYNPLCVSLPCFPLCEYCWPFGHTGGVKYGVSRTRGCGGQHLEEDWGKIHFL